jgi:hypothetical protein
MLASMLRVAAAGYDDHAVAQLTGLDPSPPRSPASTQAPSSARPSPPAPALICEAAVRTQNHQFGAAQTVARPTGNVDQNGGYECGLPRRLDHVPRSMSALVDRRREVHDAVYRGSDVPALLAGPAC